MSTTELIMTAAVFAAYFGVPAGVLIAVIYRPRLATEDVATGRHHTGRLRALRRRAGSALLAARRRAARIRRRLEATTWPVPVTADPLVHGPAGLL
ncbi:hypothetical protein [Catellatospora coxensis]|uniref:Uncharacterized protein n=1 Tax=Catellatospora coxensis TaxID=310354 RepID=A0A8J3L6Q1_9ACTN|nr:hypothetical protein [Catellatospora coxensis]GIG10179.1 hypothetical protein Cco03nite_68790 [Catellatospora coxensis]